MLRRVEFIALVIAFLSAPDSATSQETFVDLSAMISPEYPCTWPTGFPLFQMDHHRRIGPHSAYNVDILCIDPNTATQMDTPPHSVPRPDSGLTGAGPAGMLYTEKIPAWQFGGEACVIDLRKLLGAAPNGQSPLVKRADIMEWERKHRSLRFGDVVLLRTDYTDRYYKPFPEGTRFIAEPLEGKCPGWPDPDPDCMEYIASRQVMHVGTDSPSMGPIPDLAEPTHYAGLKHGGIFTEQATKLGNLPVTGAFYCLLSPKHVDGAYAAARAFAVVGDPLASQLIESSREKRALDLSVTLSADRPVWWPGRGVGNHRQPYYRIDFLYSAGIDYWHHTHMMDSHTGTHLVPPSYALPPTGLDKQQYSPQVERWLAVYEKEYGPRGTSDVTTEKVPISQTCGWARVIDVTELVGTTDQKDGPQSPEITADHVKRYEAKSGVLRPGEVVIFRSGHSDKYFKPFPEGNSCMRDPLDGKSEGWPAPGPGAIVYLATKGIRCVATDGPTLGGVDPQRALMTYWALGSRGMVGVEFLTAAGKLPEKAYFLFAALKIRGCHGGPGRAIALY